MISSSATKQLTWPLIQPYLTFLKTHQDEIDMIIKLKDVGKFKLPAAEESLTQAILEMHDTVLKLLRDNHII
jgi:hypothetical protein